MGGADITGMAEYKTGRLSLKKIAAYFIKTGRLPITRLSGG